MGGATILVDGEIVAHAHAISALDRGFLLGDACFEVLRVYGGRPFMLGAHLERLDGALVRVGFVVRPGMRELEHEVLHAIASAGLADAYVRIAVTRGDGLGLTPRAGIAPRRVVIVAPLSPPDPRMYTDGIAALVVASPFEAGALRAGGAKTTSYVEHVLAAAEARAAGADEAIFMAPSGQILEGASSNVFAVCEGVLVTPRLSTGILPGITRQVVLRLAREATIAHREGLLTLSMLRAASELFMTSSVREIVPVTRLDGRPVGEGRPGAVQERLHAQYRGLAMP